MKQYLCPTPNRRAVDAANAEAERLRDEACYECIEPFAHVGLATCSVGELCVPLCCLPLALLIFVVLIAVAIDGVIAITASQIFLPIYIAMGLFGLVLLAMCMSREGGSQRLYHGARGAIKEICCGLFFEDLEHRETPMKIFSYGLSVVAFTGVLLTAVFVNLKLNGDVHWSWPQVMIPLWVAMSMACCTSCGKCFGTDAENRFLFQVRPDVFVRVPTKINQFGLFHLRLPFVICSTATPLIPRHYS
jgi:hypothetical protein